MGIGGGLVALVAGGGGGFGRVLEVEIAAEGVREEILVRRREGAT